MDYCECETHCKRWSRTSHGNHVYVPYLPEFVQPNTLCKMHHLKQEMKQTIIEKE